MSDTKYLEMLEIPVQSCDVVIKPKKRKKKDIKEKVINMVNSGTEKDAVNTVKENKPKRKLPSFTSFFVSKNKKKQDEKKVKVKKVEDVTTRSVKVKSSRFDIISVQVVAIFVLIIGIILTNIFWENSGINTFLKSVFNEQDSVNTSTYSSFSAYSPTRSGETVLTDGVMTVNGSVYAPCDGVVESITLLEDGSYTVTVRHSSSFTSVFSNLSYSYLEENENVYANIPIGYSQNDSFVSLFSNDSLLTNYLIDGDYIVWQN